MNTRALMIASSLVMGEIGIYASFFPEEILKSLGQPSTGVLILFVQITGALYFGFAVMNWMGKTIFIGGIYARPLCMGNFSHFGIAGIALLKAAVHGTTSGYIWVPAIVYLLFAFSFGIVFFTTPKSQS